MKRKLIVIISGMAVLIVSIFLAIHMNSGANQLTNNSSNQQASHSKNGSKTLIIYFSLSGNTKQAAEQIKRYTGADIIRLQPKKAYPKGYDNYVPVAQRQLKQNIHPAIKTEISNLSSYDTVLVGFPTWWQQPPMIIHSLFEKFDFTGKTVVPFTTSMSTPVSSSMPYMRKLAKDDNAKIVNGFRYDDNNQKLRAFLQKNNLLKN